MNRLGEAEDWGQKRRRRNRTVRIQLPHWPTHENNRTVPFDYLRSRAPPIWRFFDQGYARPVLQF